MKRLSFLLLALLTSGGARAQTMQPLTPQTVEIASGSLKLKAYLWRPAGHGPFPAVVFNHGRSDSPQQYNAKLTITEAAQVLGPVFARHGYVFVFVFRRGEGLSADQGPFIGDLLRREEETGGKEARNRLQVRLVTKEHLKDAVAALNYLKRMPDVDAKRIAVAGHSFGGQLTLLEAERNDGLRAAIAFSPAAGSWEGSPALRARLLAAVDKATVPILFLQTENDYSLAANKALTEEMTRVGKRFEKRIYPKAGNSPSDGHNFLFADVPTWEGDVFAFLDENVKR